MVVLDRESWVSHDTWDIRATATGATAGLVSTLSFEGTRSIQMLYRLPSARIHQVMAD